MTVSICLPTYNRLPHLKKCLSSIFEGFEKEDISYELIVIDGGSNDGSLEYLRELDNIKLIEQGKLTGTVKAFNTCFKAAKGEYLLPISDDFFIYPKVIKKSCKLLENDENIGLISPKLQEPTYGNLHGMTIDSIKQYWMFLGEVFMFRNSLIEKIGYFDEAYRTYFVDLDFPLTILKSGFTIIFTKDVGVIHYRIRDEETNIAKSTSMQKKVSQKEKKYFEEKWNGFEKIVNEYLSNHTLEKRKALFYKKLCSIMYYSDSLRPLIKHNMLARKLYDIFLSQAIVFKDDNYDNQKDFYLAQKYPDDLLNSIS